MGRLVDLADTRLYVDERGDAAGFPLLVLHGGPGLDHTMFADYLDPLTSNGRSPTRDGRRAGVRAVRPLGGPRHVDARADGRGHPGSGRGAGLGRDYVVLGHSFGAMLALQHAVDHPGELRGTIVSAGMADARWLAEVDANLASFEPVELREQVTESWARETQVRTNEEMEQLMHDQLPFHFRDPQGAALAEYLRRTQGRAQYAPDVVRRFAVGGVRRHRCTRPARRRDAPRARASRTP
jgi:pimeloyl-ACP methyl ester carboxylesterase